MRLRETAGLTKVKMFSLESIYTGKDGKPRCHAYRARQTVNAYMHHYETDTLPRPQGTTNWQCLYALSWKRQTVNAYMHYYDTEKLSILTCIIMRQKNCKCLHALLWDRETVNSYMYYYETDTLPHQELNRHNTMSMVATFTRNNIVWMLTCISTEQPSCQAYSLWQKINAYMHHYKTVPLLHLLG